MSNILGMKSKRLAPAAQALVADIAKKLAAAKVGLAAKRTTYQRNAVKLELDGEGVEGVTPTTLEKERRAVEEAERVVSILSAAEAEGQLRLSEAERADEQTQLDEDWKATEQRIKPRIEAKTAEIMRAVATMDTIAEELEGCFEELARTSPTMRAQRGHEKGEARRNFFGRLSRLVEIGARRIMQSENPGIPEALLTAEREKILAGSSAWLKRVTTRPPEPTEGREVA